MIPRQTQAAVLFEQNRPLRLITLEIPPLQRGQVLVKIAYSGVCGTQLMEVSGRRGVDPHLPHTLGHEGSGIVIDVGEDVSKVKPGDPVILSWIRGTGHDVPSARYRSSFGEISAGAIGTFMRHTVTCESRVTALPASVGLREGALLGCAVPTGAGSLLNLATVDESSSVAIFGAGGVGLCAILAARARAARTIIAVDISGEKLAFAAEIGATQLVNAVAANPVEAILKSTAGQGVDVALEASGNARAMEAAFESVREGGGVCVLAGNAPAGELIRLDPMALIRGKRIVGTWGGGASVEAEAPIFADMFASGAFPLDRLIVAEYPLEQVNQALQPSLGRTLINMSVSAML